MPNERHLAKAFLRSSAPMPAHGPARASKKANLRVRQWCCFYGWAERGYGTESPRFEAKNRAKLGRRDQRRIFGDEE